MSSRKRTFFICIILLIIISSVSYGQSLWEGTASMGRYGEFPITGSYGASNSFTRNTLVEVKNLENGKITEVLIVDRLKQPGLFLLLSKEAAGTLDIAQDEVVNVQVAVAKQEGPDYSLLREDRPYNPDPDINPSAGLEDLEDFLFSGERSSEEPVETVEETDEVEIAEEAVEIAEEEEAVEPEEPEVRNAEETPVISDILESPEEEEMAAELMIPEENPPDIPVEESIEEEPRLAETEADDSPRVSELILIPEETETLALNDIDTPELMSGEPEEGGESLPETPRVENGFLENPSGEDEIAISELDLPEEKLPEDETEKIEKPSFIEEELSAFVPPPEDAVLVLEPAEPKPPEDMVPKAINGLPVPIESEEIAETAFAADYPELPEIVFTEEDIVEAVEEEFPEEEIVLPEVEVAEITPEPEPKEVSEELEKGSYYLQLGAFKEESLADSLAAKVQPAYPVKIYRTVLNKSELYKVLVGPLSEDEKGSLLYNFKIKGYKDAFLRKQE